VSPGGKVTVRARCESNGLVVEVEDDGPGMDPETLARAVEPFFTTKARGTGLGLPLARRLVAAHGGELALTSTPGAGTRAVLHIPPRGETP
jgi:signal transduction histidine kinase